ncbi:ribbon-helix-helix protein, CopG family [Microtetraspora fusca]|uniref:ribbon-helix-helix protein, CopG family n=1 Tax=Microtetraspora fusca TaxID=1997 RepID=UPI000831E27E|nr:ribbon-helix-helix protein, CopG family [Microtetraspora fusca]
MAQLGWQGVPVSEERIERLAAEVEEGYDVSELRRRRGRRPLGTAPAEVVLVRLDPELKAALIHRAQADHTTAGEVIRQALRSWLHVA